MQLKAGRIYVTRTLEDRSEVSITYAQLEGVRVCQIEVYDPATHVGSRALLSEKQMQWIGVDPDNQM